MRFGWAVAGCLGLSLLLRAPYLGTPLGIDEGGLAYIAQNWSQDGNSLYGPYWLDRPPLLLLLFRLAGLGGDLGVRLLGVLAAGALVVAVALVARMIAGERAGRIAALVAALLTGSVAIHAVYSPAELLAVVPSTFSVLCLLYVLRRGHARWLIGAGALAVGAALIKQSFVDAGAAGAVFLAVSALRNQEAGFRWSWPVAYAAGVALPLLGLEAWEAMADLGDGHMSYALLGFRLDALQALAASNLGLASRITDLLLPALASGLALALIAAALAFRRLRRRPIIALTLGAWLAVAGAAVLAGGTYWTHYLIQLVPGCSVTAAVLLAHLQPRVRVLALSVATGTACAVALGGLVYLTQRTPHDQERDVAAFVRANARAGDTQYVMYARANVLYYTGLPSPYPYGWSVMIRAQPGARERLYRLLASPQRPTWLVEWQDDEKWGLDHAEAVDRILEARYRRVATVCGRPIYLRTGRAAPPPPPRFDCGRPT